MAETVPGSGATLVGGTAGRTHAAAGVGVFSDFLALAQACDVIVDFTHAQSAQAHAAAIGDTGTSWVLGTTGLDDNDQSAVRTASRTAVIVQAANFCPGVSLVLAAARKLAAALPAKDYDAEILEMHHRGKQDAPSGTALAIGAAVASGRGVRLSDCASPARAGLTGERPTGAIGFASLRGGSVVGEHTLLFAGDSEHISITHSARDRSVFARGALRAAFWTRGRPPGLYGMDDVLGLTDAEGLSPR